MTKFENRLKLNQELSAKTYKEAVWSLLIAYGGALVNQEPDSWQDKTGSYYGSTVDADTELTKNALADIRKHGIDFEACSDPAPDTEFRFNGTFTSTQLQVHVLSGTLVLGDKSTYRWGTQLRDPDFGALVRLLTSDDVPIDDSIKDAVDHLAHRLNTMPDWMGKIFHPELPS